MIENVELNIGDDKFVIQSLPATRALTIAAKLMKVLGGAGAGITDFTLNIDELAKVLHVGNMVRGIITNIDTDGAPELIRTIVRESIVTPNFEGENSETRFIEWYEMRFSRGLKDLSLLLFEIFSHNYGDPLVWVKKMLARAIENGWLTRSVPSSEETNSDPTTAS